MPRKVKETEIKDKIGTKKLHAFVDQYLYFCKRIQILMSYQLK